MNRHLFKAADIAAACEKSEQAAAAAGQQPTYDDVFSWDFNYRQAGNCGYGTVLVTDVNGVRGGFRTQFEARMRSSIAPDSPAELARVNAELMKKGFTPYDKPREGDPQVTIGLYDDQPETEDDDGFVVKKGEDGMPILPPKNPYGYVLTCFNLWFYRTMKAHLDSGRIRGPLGPGEVAQPGQLIVQNTKICEPVQRCVTAKAKKHAGRELINPLARCRIRHGDDGFPKGCEVLDRKKPYRTPDGKVRYEKWHDAHGTPFCKRNAHLAIRSGNQIVAIVNRDISFSNLGISSPGIFQLLLIEEREAMPQASVDDLGLELSADEERLADERAAGGDTPAAPGGYAPPQQQGAPGGYAPPQQQAPGGYAPPQQQQGVPGGYAPPQQQPPGGYAPPQQQAPGGYAPPQQQAPGGYAPPQQQQQAPASGGYAPPQQQGPAPGGYAQAPQQQAPAPGGYAPPQQQAPAPGGYAPPQQQTPAPGGYAPPQQQGPAPGGYAPPQQQAPAPITSDAVASLLDEAMGGM